MLQKTSSLAILIPVHNAGQALERTLASIRVQSVRSHIFIIDDGSDPPIAPAEHDDSPHLITLIRLPRQRGVTRALNAGLDEILKASFDYLARADAGDVDVADRLAVQVAYLDRHPEIALVGSWTRSHDLSGAPLFVTQYPCTPAAIRRRMRYRSAFSHSSCMLRLSLLREVGRYDERYDVGQDLELFRRIAERAPCANLPDVLVLRTEEPTSVTMSRRAHSRWVRLKIQFRYLSFRDPHTVIGIGRSLLLMAVPVGIVFAYKKWRGVVR